MPIEAPDPQTYPWLGAVGIALGAWIRERRKGKKDAYALALSTQASTYERLASQETRFDALNQDLLKVTEKIGVLTGRLQQLNETNAALTAENNRLKADIATLVAEAKLKADAVIAAAVVEAAKP